MGGEVTYEFLSESGATNVELTILELDAYARAVAATLLREFPSGARVLLLYPPGEHFVIGFLGTLYAGMVAVPAYPPDPRRLDRTLPRLGEIARNAGAEVVLSTRPVRTVGAALFDRVPGLARLPWIMTEEVMLDGADTWRQPTVRPDATALLQYTSGSTGTPRGVVVTHENLLSNGRAIEANFDLTRADITVSWLPFYHDMGLLGGILQPLLTGISTILLPPLGFLRRPLSWLELVAARGATVSGGPNFAFDLCVDKSTESQRAQLDLSTWRVAFCGAEPIRSRTMTRFAAAFAVAGFDSSALLPCYGLAEATLLVAGSGRGRGVERLRVDRAALQGGRAEPSADGDDVVSSGRVARGHDVAIVGPESRERLPDGHIGEVWVTGSSVAAGYRGDDAATAATFTGELPGDSGPYLRTGDLGFVLDDRIYVTGRLKEMMVVRGRNLYPADLEETAALASRRARAGGGAAFGLDTDEGERFVIMQEIAGDTPASELPEIAEAIGSAVAQEHGVSPFDVMLLAPRSLAKTSSGKTQRLTARAAYLAGAVDGERYRRSETAVGSGDRPIVFASREDLLALGRDERIEQIARQLPGARPHGGSLPDTDPDSELSLDSLEAVKLAFDIEEQLGVVIGASDLLRMSSRREIAVAVDAGLPVAHSVSGRPAPKPRIARTSPLSAGQDSQLLMRELEGADWQQNVSVAVRLRDPVDLRVLAAAVRYIGARHPILTSSFVNEGGGRRHHIDPDRTLELEVVPLAGAESTLRSRVDHRALAPFDIERGEVARATLFTGIGSPVLVLAQHHAITDFWSVATLFEELATVYSRMRHGHDPHLPPTVGYEDFVRWQQDYERSSRWAEDRRYWLDLLAGEIHAPALPYRERAESARGIESHRVAVAPELVTELELLARTCGATLFSVLLTAFERLIAAHSGESEFLVGTTTTGRPEARFRNTLGYFSNIIPVRAEPDAHPSVAELISSTGRQIRESLEHQHFPYGRLVEAVRAGGNSASLVNAAVVFERPHNIASSDVTSVMFGAGADSATLGDLTLEPFPIGELAATQFDITLHIVPVGAGLLTHMLIRSDRFDPGFAELLAGQYVDLLRQIAPGLAAPVSSLRLAGAAESLTRGDVRARALPGVTSVHELFEASADRTPGAIALAAQGVELSYAQVDSAANEIADNLRRQGIRPEDKVGLCLRRSPELVIAMLAVLKSGAAFVPLDPDLPHTRLTDMVADAECARILCHAETAAVAATLGPIVRIDARTDADAPRPDLAVTGDNLAYIIFTSGSTGRPKGAQIEHRSLLSFLLSFLDTVDIRPGDRVLQFAPLTFDACIEEILTTWIRGATLVLRDDAAVESPQRFWEWCARHRVTHVDLPTAFFHILVTALDGDISPPPSLRAVLIAGEAVHPDKLARWFDADVARIDLFNRWGATEATVCSTFALLGPESGRRARARDISIGTDMTDAVVHVLDAALQPVPDGVVGEAYIGGVGVGRGYASEPRKTAERFVPDPFATEPGRRLYATGDLVRRAGDGELRYIGRADQQVKVRGYRVELGEVDVALRRHPDVVEAAVIAARGSEGTELLAAVTGAVDPRQLRDWLHRQLPGYMVPARLLVLDHIPLTPNGKIDAAALRDRARAQDHSPESAAMSTTEGRLAALWSDVLELDRVGLYDDFFASGGHSLRAANLNTRVRAEFGIEPPLRMFFESVTVRAQAERIDELLAAGASPVATPDITSPVAPRISLGQKRLWFLDRVADDPRAYVVAGAIRLSGALDLVALRRALDALVERHSALRTGFRDEGGHPAAIVREGVGCPFQRVDRTAVEPAERESEWMRVAADHAGQPFDLGEPPLMRATLVEFTTTEHTLVLAFHHIVFDGWSLRIVARELAALYGHWAQGGPEPLPPTGDYSRWAAEESAWLESESGRAGSEFWSRELNGAPQVLDLPFDRPRAAVQTFTGARIPLTLGAEDSALLRALTGAQQATIFMALAAGLSATLARLSGQQRVILGVPDANRPVDGRYDDTIGFFVNTLPLCFEVSGAESGRALIDRARATTLRAMPWRSVPFSAIVDAVCTERDPGRNPLFQVLLDVRSDALPAPALADLRAETVPLYTGTAKADLTFEITDDGGALTGWLEYNADLFDPESVRHIASLFSETMRAIAHRPDESITTPASAATLDRRPSDIGPHELPDTFWSRFVRMVEASPDTVALEAADRTVTYGELRNQVEQVARNLMRQFGTAVGDIVAVEVASSIEAVIAVLGVQRCGATYVPIDPAYPAERRDFMLEDSGARTTVTREFVETALRAPAHSDPLPRIIPDAAAYLMYTSGSTGRPKAALISHRNLANHAAAQAGSFGIRAGSRLLRFASLSFDGSVWEIFSTLASGATLCLADHDHALVGADLADTLAARDITVCLLPPSVLATLPHREFPRLEVLISAGEPCRPELVARWQPGRRFLNGYGPTECTVMILTAECLPGQPISLGSVLPNAAAYVLGPDLEPVVVGAIGELYVGGPGVGIGYHNRPGSTAECFVPDPHSPLPGARMYRTGDLVRVRGNGIVEYCGRRDHQLKVRGYRIELGEIEAAVRAVPGVCDVVVRHTGGSLVAYVEARHPAPTPRMLEQACAGRLPAYMVPAAYVVSDALPRLPGGKVDPGRLGRPRRADFVNDPFSPLESDAERLIGGIWSEVLGVDEIGSGDDFFALGGQSLLATVVTARVNDGLGADVSLRALFEAPVLRDYAVRVTAAGKASSASRVRDHPRLGEAPLSVMQERLWILEELDRDAGQSATGGRYHLSGAIRLTGPLDAGALERALARVIDRHAALRTVFHAVDGVLSQRVLDRVEIPLSGALTGTTVAQRLAEARGIAERDATTPMDLAVGPLLRARLLQIDRDDAVLVLTLHHIVGDGWSLEILERDLAHYYSAEIGRPPGTSLPPLEVTYEQFARWQRHQLESGALDASIEYWRKQLDDLPGLDLPVLRSGSTPAPPGGGRVVASIPEPLRSRIEQFAVEAGATLFMVLAAALQITLGRLSGQRDFAIGVPVAGRRHREVEDLIGFFVNSVVLRADLAGNPSFSELLDRVRTSTLDAYEHQDVPFETLVKTLAPERDLSTTPLFRVYLNVLNIPSQEADLPGLRLETFAVPDLAAKFDLTFYVDPTPAHLAIDLVHADRFDPEAMEELLAQWVRVLEQAVCVGDRPIDALDLETPLARRVLPGPTEPLDGTWFGSVVEHFERWAEREPRRIAISESGQELTYGELARSAAELAGVLIGRGVEKGDVVAIYGVPGAALVRAILGVLRAGASFAVLDASYPASRLADCVAVAKPVAVLRLEAAGAVPAPVVDALGERAMRCRIDLPGALDEMRRVGPAGDLPGAVPVGPNDCAYLAFTSGSSGTPKGIRGAHGSLTHFVPWMRETFGLGDTDRYSMLSGISHDPLHREVFTPLSTGATICIPAPDDVGTPGRLAEWFRAQRISVSHLTPPMARLFGGLTVDAVTVPSLTRIFFTGDSLTSRDVRAVTRVATTATCVNLYGSTETQRAVGYFVVPAEHTTGDEDPGIVYPLGRGMKDVQLLVLTEAGTRAGIGEIGEIAVRSAHIALGYVDGEQTAAAFVRNPFVADADATDRIYRTGDLGRYALDGSVLSLGRADSQVKIRGYRVEPDEVRRVVCAAPGIRDALVVARTDASGESSLIAYVIPSGDDLVANDVTAFVRTHLPTYMVPAFVVAIDAFPLTPNRKIDRAALPAPIVSARTDGPVPVLSTTEELVAEVWQDVLGVDRVLPDDNFFDLGGHSLLATRVVARLRRLFGWEVALRTLFESQTVRQLAGHIDDMVDGRRDTEPIAILARTEPLPSSYGQERLWLLDQLEGETHAYNTVAAVRLRGRLDTGAFSAALDDLVERHETLRTRFTLNDGSVHQVVEAVGTVTMPLDVIDVGSDLPGAAENHWQRCIDDAAGSRFDLSRAPLEKATLVRIAADDHVFVLTVHHIVADAWGMQVLIRDVVALYQARNQGIPSSLEPLRVQYADWASWQRSRFERGDYRSQLDFWLDALATAPPLLEFPAQRIRPAVMTNRGVTVRRVLPNTVVDKVRRVGRENSATLFMTLLAAFTCQLHRYSGAEDIAVGVPVSTRAVVETEDVVGFFVNTLVCRNRVSGAEPFTRLLDRVRSTTLAAFANQDVPFDRVVEALQPHRDLSRNPLFQVMFVLHNAPRSEIDLGDLELERVHTSTGTAKFDVSLDLAEEDGGLHAALELNADLFDAETGQQMLDHFETVLNGIVDAPHTAVADLELRSDAEVRAYSAFGTGPEPLEAWTAAESLEYWSHRTPDEPAVIDGAVTWSYREFRDLVAGLAEELAELTDGSEPAIVVCAERSVHHIAAAIACGEVGATYVPVSPAFPDRRIASILGAFADVIVLTDDDRAERIAALAGPARPQLVLGTTPIGARPLGQRPPCPRQRAYVIFTSGTTGEPKGVLIEQVGLLNHLELMARELDLSHTDVIAQTAPQSFDISIWQMLVAFGRGASTAVSRDDISRDAAALIALVRERKITVLQLVPGMIRAVLDDAEPGDLRSLRYLIATGEELPADLCTAWLRRFPGIPIVNAYGPAECSDDTHLAILSAGPGDHPVTLGRPVAGATSHVIDEDGRAQPFGVPGELAIGGLVVGRGYLGDPRATAERFVPDPFGTRPGARLYRTGDRARLLRDGRLEFLGRTDDQVKVRGFRIETGEVETALRETAGVTDAAVVVRGPLGEEDLLAWVVGAERDPARVVAALSARLPRYMIPGGYVFVDDLPRTPNGKIDRSALRRAVVTVERARRPYEELAGRTERLVAAAYESLLGCSSVGAFDDFFELGGHSLLAARLVSELSGQADVDLPLRAVFEHPTVRGLASAFDELQLASLSEVERLELEALLEQLSDDEARAILAREQQNEETR
ncbi:non-ribosomal peptide synthetase [Nocardia terpenica]|uniref:non-ribosomal peptide synthetase n=1 Tax=Nocardia terpenica TaxID=455432 RepID=UPI00142D27F2|nr:non-ribosomal peptide synthetase [Nocardia terpenica]